MSDVLLWTTSLGRASVGQPTRTYQQQIYTDTVCTFEDLLEVMDDRDEWQERNRDRETERAWEKESERERVREIYATNT